MGLGDRINAALVKARNSKQAKKNPIGTLKTKASATIPTGRSAEYDNRFSMRHVERNLDADLKDRSRGPGGLGRNERLKLEKEAYKDKKLYLPKNSKPNPTSAKPVKSSAMPITPPTIATPVKGNSRIRGTFGVEIDGKESNVKGVKKTIYRNDGTVKKTVFRAKGIGDSPVNKINDVKKYKKS